MYSFRVDSNTVFAEVSIDDDRLIIRPSAVAITRPLAAPIGFWLIWTAFVVAASMAIARFVGWERVFGGRLGINTVHVDIVLSMIGGAIAAANALTGMRRDVVVFDRNAGFLYVNDAPIERLWEIAGVSVCYRFTDSRTRLIRIDLWTDQPQIRTLYETTHNMRDPSAAAGQPPCPDYREDDVDDFVWFPYAGENCGLGPPERQLIEIALAIARYLDLPPPILPNR